MAVLRVIMPTSRRKAQSMKCKRALTKPITTMLKVIGMNITCEMKFNLPQKTKSN